MEEEASDLKSWAGDSMEAIYRGRGPWRFKTKPIVASRNHTVLFHLPATVDSTPKPHYSSQSYHWNKDYVRMPCCAQNLYPVKNENGQDELKSRWEIIETSLLQTISSSYELEAAMFSYNNKLPKLTALHYFFNEILEEEESNYFFSNILPEVIRLALKLPQIIPSNIPLLKQGVWKAISLSQLQVSSLLANAFLCTFPWGKEMAETFPGINFTRLYTAHLRPDRINSVSEKLKCICHYFKRVTSKAPIGVITFERKFISKMHMPRWDNLDKNMGNNKIHVSSTGTIEDDGLGLLQVDFANKYVGGGVLGYGCVQEEIRYVICPELIVSRLFTEQLTSYEALEITGIERFSNYKGYGDSFEWDGNHQDCTPFDESGRRKTSIVAIDATRYNRPADQFNSSAMLRELNKAHVGFYSHGETDPMPVATGNWGCGAFKGDTRLKSLLQLMACAVNERDMVYYTFGDKELCNDIHKMYIFLKINSVTITQLWRYLQSFSKAGLSPKQLYSFIQQAHFDSKSPIQNKSFFWFTRRPNENNDLPSTSSTIIRKTEQKQCKNTNKDDTTEVSNEEVNDDDADFIDSSQPEEELNKKFSKRYKISDSPDNTIANKMPKSDDVIRLIDEIHGREKKYYEKDKFQESLVASLSKLSGEFKTDETDSVSNESTSALLSNKEEPTVDLTEKCEKKQKTKITDYFEVCRK